MVPTMRVAVGQFSATGDKAENQQGISRLAESAARAGAQLAVFPELAMVDLGPKGGDFHGEAEALDGPFVENLARLAERLELTIALGIYESIPGDARVHNTAVVLDPRRGLVAAYRKRNLYDAFGEKESDNIRPGSDEPPLFQLGGFTVALIVGSTSSSVRSASLAWNASEEITCETHPALYPKRAASAFWEIDGSAMINPIIASWE